MNKFLLLLGLLLPFYSFGNNENRIAGARAAGLGTASVALTDSWSGFYNQAGLALLQKKSIGVSYENRFQTKELSTKAFCFNFPSTLGSFSLNYTQFGFELYKESKIGLAYSRALGKHFWVGIQLDQLRKDLNAEFGSQSKYSFELGLLAEIANDFYLGFHIFNPTQEKFETWEYDDQIPSIARFGFSWKLSNASIISSELLKDLDNALVLKLGVEYPINKNIILRVGMHNHPNSVSMGLGFNFKPLQANLAFSRHPVLGYTPSADFSFQF